MSVEKTSADNEAARLQIQDGLRLYVGNLSFKTTEETLRAHLTPAGGNITSVDLPQKFGGKRPAGFGFADYATEEDVKNVVEKLNGSELDGRKIKLSPARNAEETDKYRAERNAGRAERQAARDAAQAAKADKAAAAAAEKGETTAGGDTTAVTDGEPISTTGDKKKKRPNKKRAPRRRQPGEEGEEGTGEATDAAPDATTGEAGEGGEAVAKPKAKRRNSRKPKAANEARIDGVEGEAAEGGEATEKPAQPKREKKPRAPRVRSEPTGEVSKTTIFVANLPFDLDDEGLAAIFTNLSINVKSAKVATRLKRFPKALERKSERASRGFGFVDVEDPAQQSEAVEKVEGTLVGDRTISARAANEMREIEREVEELKEEAAEAEAKEAKADAPAATA